jgi:hypothetical protein
VHVTSCAQNALQTARIHELEEQRLSDLRRLVVVVIKNQPNQLYGAVGTAAGQGTMRERERIQRDLLN